MRGGRGRAANRMDAMKPAPLPLLAAAAALAAGALLGACGSQTKTVSVAGAPPARREHRHEHAGERRDHQRDHRTDDHDHAGPTPRTAARPRPPATHTAPEPAFTEGQAAAEGVSGAAAVVRARGFTPTDTSDYHPEQALRVLIGTRSGSSDGYGQQAFFFVNGRYIGTDSSQPSATVKVVSQSDTEVTLAYPLYRRGDPLSSPSGGQAKVRFQLNNGKLVALGPIPPASPRPRSAASSDGHRHRAPPADPVIAR